MTNKVQFIAILLVFGLILGSCSKTPKESAGNLSGTVDEATKTAVTKLGDAVKVVYKGDMNGNKKDDALALVINKDFGGNRYWIQKGSVLEKDGSEWKTILSMEEELSSTKGKLVEQMPAKNGYLVNFKTEQSPMNLYISIADANGRPASDEAIIKWNSKESVYEFSAAPEGSTP